MSRERELLVPSVLSENERELATDAWDRADRQMDALRTPSSARKWGNLVLEAYDALEAQHDHLRARTARYDRLITQAIDAEVSFETVQDVRGFLEYGLEACRE